MGKLGQKQNRTPKEKVSALIKSSAVDTITLDDASKDTSDVNTDPIDDNEGDSTTDDFVINPDKLASEFRFEKSNSSDSNPLNQPLADETNTEGKTMEKLGYEAKSTGNNNEPPPPPKDKKITLEDSMGGDNTIDDIPPPNPNEKDIFDESASGVDGEGHELPKGFVEWSAKKQADFIVNTEAALFEGFAKNKSKINLIDLKQRLTKYNLPSEAKAEIIMQVSDFNDQVEEHLKIEDDMRKNLKAGWEAVLSQHSNISKHLTPEATLAITHGLVIWKLWQNTKELKDYGKSMLIEIKEFLKPYAQQQKASEKNTKADRKTEQKPEPEPAK
jgi:hypothetical protein